MMTPLWFVIPAFLAGALVATLVAIWEIRRYKSTIAIYSSAMTDAKQRIIDLERAHKFNVAAINNLNLRIAEICAEQLKSAAGFLAVEETAAQIAVERRARTAADEGSAPEGVCRGCGREVVDDTELCGGCYREQQEELAADQRAGR